MWSVIVIAVLVALTGFYRTADERHLATAEGGQAMAIAESMVVYREAVIKYYTATGLRRTSVNLATLKAANVVPTWSTLYTQSSNSIWANYRDANGMIYVYASSQPPVDIQAELAQLSENSYLVGAYKQSGVTLYSPVFGDTGISLVALAGKSVPDNAPVWLGFCR